MVELVDTADLKSAFPFKEVSVQVRSSVPNLKMILLTTTYEPSGFEDVNWFYFIGPIIVYIILEIMSNGNDGFDGFD